MSIKITKRQNFYDFINIVVLEKKFNLTFTYIVMSYDEG